jgi:membrane fusion protein, multidrug efflux system
MKRIIALIISLSVLLFAVQCGKPAAKDNNDKKAETAKTTDQKESSKKDDKDKKESTAKNDKKGKKGDKDKGTEAVPVQVVSPTIGDISSFLLFSSNMDSEKVVDIYPMTFGIIEKIHFDEGQQVKKGDVLAVLDDREASINEKKADINYRNLKNDFERQKEIYEKQMLSKEEFERLRFNMETAKLDWQQKKLSLSYTRITTPISGVVTKRYIKIGNRINTSQLSFSVVSDKEKIAVVNIPEQEKDSLYIKQNTVIYSGKSKVNGFVKRISPAIDPDSGTFKVTVAVRDPKNKFSVGQFVNVKIIKKVHQNAVLLTKDAVIYEGGKCFIFVVDKKNEAIKKTILIGFEEGNIVEVIQGLEKNEKVVTAGKSSLRSKTLVKVVEPVVG